MNLPSSIEGVERLTGPRIAQRTAAAARARKNLLNPTFFKEGHKSPWLHDAYTAAKSARFEYQG